MESSHSGLDTSLGSSFRGNTLLDEHLARVLQARFDAEALAGAVLIQRTLSTPFGGAAGPHLWPAARDSRNTTSRENHQSRRIYFHPQEKLTLFNNGGDVVKKASGLLKLRPRLGLGFKLKSLKGSSTLQATEHSPGTDGTEQEMESNSDAVRGIDYWSKRATRIARCSFPSHGGPAEGLLESEGVRNGRKATAVQGTWKDQSVLETSQKGLLEGEGKRNGSGVTVVGATWKDQASAEATAELLEDSDRLRRPARLPSVQGEVPGSAHDSGEVFGTTLPNGIQAEAAAELLEDSNRLRGRARPITALTENSDFAHGSEDRIDVTPAEAGPATGMCEAAEGAGGGEVVEAAASEKASCLASTRGSVSSFSGEIEVVEASAHPPCQTLAVPAQLAGSKSASSDHFMGNEQSGALEGTGRVGNSEAIAHFTPNRALGVPSAGSENQFPNFHGDHLEPDQQKSQSLAYAPSAPPLHLFEGTEEERLARNLSMYGFQAFHMAFDSACQFRSIAHQLCRDPEQHMEVRETIVRQLKRHKSQYTPFVTLPFPEYVRQISSGWWGDFVTLKAAADKYQARVTLITSAADSPPVEILPASGNPQINVYLSHYGGRFFNSILPFRAHPSGPQQLPERKVHWVFR